SSGPQPRLCRDPYRRTAPPELLAVIGPEHATWCVHVLALGYAPSFALSSISSSSVGQEPSCPVSPLGGSKARVISITAGTRPHAGHGWGGGRDGTSGVCEM